MLRPFSLLVKPSSFDCNLRCEYCFYLEKSENYPQAKRPRMSDQVLERMIQTYMHTQQPQYSIGWQGGEPTLMGVDFFRRAVEFEKKYGRNQAVVGNGLQTNGVLIDVEFAKFLAHAHFLTGISVDGPAEIHNQHRLNAAGRGSYADVMRGFANLKRAGAEFNVLTLVSDANVGSPDLVYNHQLDNGVLFHQYISCVEHDADGHLLPFSITGPQWGEFMCRIFDLWYPNDTRRVSVRLFDSILGLLVDGARNVCHFGRDCRQYFVVEHNGDIYPCDFFVEKRLRLGNIMNDSWEQLQSSPVYRDFGLQKVQYNPICGNCEYLDICQGDCLKHRLCKNGGDPHRMSVLCEGWKMFFSHTRDKFRLLAEEVRAEREKAQRVQQLQAAGKMPGRNDPCPCGSGRKYKKCCGR